MKNRVQLEHYFPPGDLQRQIAAFVDYFNNERFRESLGKSTRADVDLGHDQHILKQQEGIKRKTILKSRLRQITENAGTQSRASRSLQ